MPRVTADPEVRRVRALRLRAQGLVPGVRDWRTAADVARGMLAMQGQDAAWVRWALSLRAGTRPDDAAVLADLAERRVVRNRPSRGTLQVTAPEDLHWLSETLTPASRRAAAQRRHQIGVTTEMIAGVEARVRELLAGGVSATRPEVVAACAEAGVAMDSTQAGHVLRELTETMVIVFADPVPKADVFALADDWITARRVPEHALGEVVTRFVAARGPVTRHDVARWAALTLGDVDAGVEAAGAALERVALAGATWLVERGSAGITDAQVESALAAPLLLPGFDEYLLGYGSRDPQLDPAGLTRIVPGGNGVYKPMVVVDGEIVGIWSRRATTRKVSVSLEPFVPLTAATRERVGDVVDDFGAFLGRKATLV